MPEVTFPFVCAPMFFSDSLLSSMVLLYLVVIAIRCAVIFFWKKAYIECFVIVVLIIEPIKFVNN